MFLSTNLTATYGWSLPATLGHNTDPLDWVYTTALYPVFFSLGDAVTDSDGNGIPDAREIRLFGTNPTLADSDADGDGLDSLWEYQHSLNPDVVNTGYVRGAASLAIDNRLIGKSAATAKKIFSVQDHANAHYVRNTNCWAADIDLTCASPWNSQSANLRAGTLISPRHVVFAWHNEFYVHPGHTLRFIDSTNGGVDRVVVAVKQVMNTGIEQFDIMLGILDSDVPPNRISFAKILPPDYTDYFGSKTRDDIVRIPVIRFDQEEKALVGDLNFIWQNTGCSAYCQGKRLDFYEKIICCDSGNPCFVVINDEPVLLCVWHFGIRGGEGTSPTYWQRT